jgi:hypothetical protein
LQQCLDADTGLADVEYGFLAMTGGAKSLLAAPTSTQYAWPHDVPVPGVDRKALPIQQQAAFDLTLMSTAFAFLHELRHVMFRHDDVAQPAAEEELACDVWARAFITSGITNYSRLNQLPYDQVLRKRSMASVVGVFTLYETSCRWGDAGTSDYPPIADRMDAALRGTQLPPNDPFWIYYASILLAILRSRHCHFSVAGATGQEYCESMIDEIRRTS